MIETSFFFLMPDPLTDEDCQGSSPKERLLEIIMRRFELMEPHKKDLLSTLKALCFQWPRWGACYLADIKELMRSARVGREGPLGTLQVTILGVIYGRLLVEWLQGELSLEGVMARLDRALTWCDGRMERYS